MFFDFIGFIVLLAGLYCDALFVLLYFLNVIV